MMTTETTTTTTKKTGYGACVVDSNDANKNTDGAAEASSSSNITFLELLSQNTNFLFYWLSFVVNRMVRTYSIIVVCSLLRFHPDSFFCIGVCILLLVLVLVDVQLWPAFYSL